MRFRQAHKLASFLLAATSVLTLASSGALAKVTLPLLALAFLLSWFADPETRVGGLFERSSAFLNLATLLLLAFAVFEVARSFPEVDLSPFLNFVLFLLAYKLCQRRSNRDYLQIYVLSFLVMLAAAWMATGIVFLAGFSAYVFLATWTLILFHLRREIEENYIVRHTSESQTEPVTATRVLNSRRVVGVPFFVATGAVALLVLTGATFIFAAVPRIGLGFLLGGVRRQSGMAGFSDEVKLGRDGVISTDNLVVVMRASVPRIAAIEEERKRERTISGLYWRGTVYDTYDKGQWLRSREEKIRTHLTPAPSSVDFARSYFVDDAPDSKPALSRRTLLSDTDEQRIELLALSHPVAFALDRPVAFEIPPSPPGSFTTLELEPRWSGEVLLRMLRINPGNASDRQPSLADFPGASYRAYSRDPTQPSTPQPHGAPSLSKHDLVENYLRIPKSLSARVSNLAKQITEHEHSDLGKAQAVVAWLQRTHGYTTDLKRNSSIADPLEDFLFAQKAGHCEYFASAAAVLLRASGVPTRYVNGFLGGEWNDLRKVITVRENRAHSWIEAYLSQGIGPGQVEAGWTRVDATPALSRPAHMTRMRQLLDSAELFWERWVVEYNASQQLLLAQRLGQKFGFSRRSNFPSAGQVPLTKKTGLFLAGLAVLTIVLVSQRKVLLRWRRSRRAASVKAQVGQPIVRIYQSTLARLAAMGMPRHPAETPHEYVARLRCEGVQGEETLSLLTECYTSARYGEAEIPPEQVAELRRQCKQIGAPP